MQFNAFCCTQLQFCAIPAHPQRPEKSMANSQVLHHRGSASNQQTLVFRAVNSWLDVVFQGKKEAGDPGCGQNWRSRCGKGHAENVLKYLKGQYRQETFQSRSPVPFPLLAPALAASPVLALAAVRSPTQPRLPSCRGSGMCQIGGFPKMGVPPVIIHFGLGFSLINYKHHPFWGTPPPFMETPILMKY